MSISITAVIVATIAQFIVGAAWYSALFGKLWGQIHGFDKLSKEVQKEMVSKMGPLYGLQLVVTILTTWALARIIVDVPSYNAYGLGALIWIGFIVPAQVSAVIFGGTEPKWIVSKILIQSGAALACTMVGAAVLSAML